MEITAKGGSKKKVTIQATITKVIGSKIIVTVPIPMKVTKTKKE
jgi:hypothetical protein